MPDVLRIDVETYSSVDLRKSGLARYVAAPDFSIMLLAYKWIRDGAKEPTRCVDIIQGDDIPDDVFLALNDPAVIKTAFNAAFEIATIGEHFDIELDPAQWRCTMVHAMHNGLPGNLADVCEVLGTKYQKDFRGSSLIRTFCVPCKPTKKNGQRTRNLPAHDPDRWELFKHYNILDVECEDEVADRVATIPMSDTEWGYWRMDHRMNERGVRVDLPLVRNAIELDTRIKEKLTARAVSITGLSNPNSVKQLKAWLTEEIDYEVKTLNKASIPLLESMTTDRAAEVLALRAELGRTSVSKYHAMLRSADDQGYIRGLTQFYGANRTGRAAGRMVQLQNLRKNAMAVIKNKITKAVEFDELALARELLRRGDFEMIELFWGSVLDVLSQLTRTALIPDEGCMFTPVDFSAIEARKLAWAAREEWRLEVFRTHGKIYEASASAMFKVPIESVTKGSAYRAKGKAAELACVAYNANVLTDLGLVPIQDVTTKMLLWDGVEWVSHEGVIDRGERETIEYRGLWATPDHIVWTHEEGPVQLGRAAARRSRLVQSATGRTPIRVGRGDDGRTQIHERLVGGLRADALYRVWLGIVAKLVEPISRLVARMLLVFASSRTDLRGCVVGGDAEAQELAGHQVQTRTTRVFDILNAGPRNRFTAGGYLVHNCGYQGGEGALIRMGALEMGLGMKELKPIIASWRAANLRIAGQSYRDEPPGLWERMNDAALRALELRNGRLVDVDRGIGFRYNHGVLFMRLPSGRELCYCKPTIEDGDFGPEVNFWGMNQVTKQWEQQKSYGGRWVENLCQASSRDLLYHKLCVLESQGLHDLVRFHVHDEVVPSVPKDIAKDTLQRIEDIFGEEVPWAPGLPLRGDGFITPFFRKDD